MRRSLDVTWNKPEAGRFPDRGSRRSSCASPEHFFRLEVENASPKVQVILALTVLTPIFLSGLFLIVFIPQLWWVFTTYGWISFPALSTLARGLSGLAAEPSGKQQALATAEGKEQELLAALAKHGELTPTRASMETSLSVAEADEKLNELAEGGYLEVRVRGGGLFYALWGAEDNRIQ